MSEQGTGTLLVTIGGQCVEVTFEGQQRKVDRDVFLYYFNLKDAGASQATRYVSVGITWEASTLIKEFDARAVEYSLNVIRRALDDGTLTFEGPPPSSGVVQELTVKTTYVQQTKPKVTGPELRTYVLHKAYWLGFKFTRDPGRYWVDFGTSLDLDYLGVNPDEVARVVWLLNQQGLLQMKAGLKSIGKPTHRLVELYESDHQSEVAGARVFPKGTNYDSYKEISRILRSATKTVTVVDNYVNSALLDLIAALPSSLQVRIFTWKTPADFPVAVGAFRAQYGHTLEVRRHAGDLHDRVVIIDDRDWYLLGASIKDAGNKLWVIQKLDDENAIKALGKEIERIWAAASPI